LQTTEYFINGLVAGLFGDLQRCVFILNSQQEGGYPFVDQVEVEDGIDGKTYDDNHQNSVPEYLMPDKKQIGRHDAAYDQTDQPNYDRPVLKRLCVI
jgi:hypothetical protein